MAKTEKEIKSMQESLEAPGKRTLALRVSDETSQLYERAAKLIGTTNSNLLGILLKHYIDTKLKADFTNRVGSQIEELEESAKTINITDLMQGKVGRPSKKAA